MANSSDLLWASFVHLTATVPKVPEGYKVNTLYKSASSFITQQKTSLVFSVDTFQMNRSVFWQLIDGRNFCRVVCERKAHDKMCMCF